MLLLIKLLISFILSASTLAFCSCEGFFPPFFLIKKIYYYYFSTYIFCLLFLFFSCCSYSLVCINLLYLLLFNFSFLSFFSSFSLFFSPYLLVCFAFIALFPSCHIALVLFSSLGFSFVFNWLISFLLSFAHQINLFYFLNFFFDCFGFGYVCIQVYTYKVQIGNL